MMRGNPAPTWHQRSRLSGLMHLLAPALAAGAVTAPSLGWLQAAWVALVTALACYAVRLENYPIHLMPVARPCARVGGAVMGSAVAVATVYLASSGSTVRAVLAVAAAGVTAAAVAVIESVAPPSDIRVAIVGDRSFAKLLALQFQRSGARGFVFAASCQGSVRREEFVDVIASDRIDLVVIENRLLSSPETERVVDWCFELRVRLTDSATMYERVLGHVPVGVIRSAWFRAALDPERAGSRANLRRLRDLLTCTVTMVVLAPLFLTVTAAVAVCDGRPVFFRQRRVGKRGRQVELLKFRTTRVADDAAPRWADADDARITSLGALLRRSHLDEMPQLINMLRGEMTLVGPRPEQPGIVEILERAIPFYTRRHLVTPGITGWAQVECGYAGSTLGTGWKIGHDLYYLRHRTLVFDALIMIETLHMLGAYHRYSRAERDPDFLLARGAPTDVRAAVDSSSASV
jgi:lipopolysaccharide/colanic/teichoic acid biosynthesis glycosyltransferase